LGYPQHLVINLEKGPAGTKKVLINMKKEWENIDDNS
jgi:hypothetical protein